jgi:post-segregation antitoxin (ccd killing protein)
MERHSLRDQTKRGLTVSLRADLIDEANRLGVNISEACERGLAEAVSRAWLDENRAAGMPVSKSAAYPSLNTGNSDDTWLLRAR